MKKVIALTLALVMTVVLFGCGGASSAAPVAPAAPAAPAAPVAPAAPAAPAAPVAPAAVSYPKLNLSMSCSGADLGIDAVAGRYMAEIVGKASGGNIKISVFPNAQLAGGSQAKTPELLAAGGGYELAFCSGANLSSLSEMFQTHQLP